MQAAKTLLESGNLSGAIEAALSLVKSKPTDVAARTFLFELSLFSGDWERADRQLDAIGHQDANTAMGSLIYRQTLAVEKERAKFFISGGQPDFISGVPKYVKKLVEANEKMRSGNLADARKLLDEVDEERPAFACKINGEDAADFRDYNDLTSCVFEAIIKDQYVWIPFEQVQKIEFFKPKSLRDTFWIQAKIDTKQGLGGEMIVPALYANSFKSHDDEIRLGRTVDWQDLGDDIYMGEGVKFFSANNEGKAISQIETIEFTH